MVRKAVRDYTVLRIPFPFLQAKRSLRRLWKTGRPGKEQVSVKAGAEASGLFCSLIHLLGSESWAESPWVLPLPSALFCQGDRNVTTNRVPRGVRPCQPHMPWHRSQD